LDQQFSFQLAEHRKPLPRERFRPKQSNFAHEFSENSTKIIKNQLFRSPESATKFLNENCWDRALGDPALILKRHNFAGDTTGHHAFARPIKPHELEICTAISLAAAEG
jgi:hypothetical protein